MCYSFKTWDIHSNFISRWTPTITKVLETWYLDIEILIFSLTLSKMMARPRPWKKRHRHFDIDNSNVDVSTRINNDNTGQGLLTSRSDSQLLSSLTAINFYRDSLIWPKLVDRINIIWLNILTVRLKPDDQLLNVQFSLKIIYC